MSSMARRILVTALIASAAFGAPHAVAQDSQGSAARASLVAAQPSPQIASAISRWEQLSASPNFTFQDYASFLMTWPGFPDEAKLRGYAEERLAQEYANPSSVIAFFDRFPPLTNTGKAQRAMALMATRPAEALAAAREAWRGGIAVTQVP